MSKCELSITLERADRTFRPGEVVRGHVRVRTDAAVPCRRLVVVHHWRTHGRGNVRSGPEQGVSLFEGEWRAGEDQSYAFEVTLPNGPSTYRGHYLNIDHYVVAKADVPWSLDPTATVDIVLTGERGPTYDHGPQHKSGPPDVKAEGAMAAVGSVLIAGFFGVPGLGMLLGGAAFGVIGLMRRDPALGFPGLILMPFGAVLVAVSAGVAFALHKRTLAQRKLGTPVLTVEPRMAVPGQEVAVHLALTPRSPVSLTRGVVLLRGQERVVSGTGTNRTTHTHVFQLQEAGLDLPSDVRAGSTLQRSVVLAVPADAPPSFGASDNDLQWAVVVRIGIAGWPDWEREYPITVAP
jgi:hypothetical protein